VGTEGFSKFVFELPLSPGVNMNFGRLVFCLALGLLSGCAQNSWQRAGASQADFDADKYVCERDASSIYPVNMVDVKLRDQVYPGVTACTGNGSGNIYGGQISTNSTVRCTTTPERVVPGATVFRRDENLIQRGSLISSCLKSRGWRLVRSK